MFQFVTVKKFEIKMLSSGLIILVLSTITSADVIHYQPEAVHLSYGGIKLLVNIFSIFFIAIDLLKKFF